jgi:hypothetical protein
VAHANAERICKVSSSHHNMLLRTVQTEATKQH